MAKFYQVVGWYKSLAREHVGKSTTISDGARFSRPEHALAYLHQKMRQGEVRVINADPLPCDVDYYLTAGLWTPPA